MIVAFNSKNAKMLLQIGGNGQFAAWISGNAGAPVGATANYITLGANNFVQQQTGSGIEF